MPGILRVYLENPGYTWKIPCDRLGIVPISSILPQTLPQTSSQTQGNSRVSRMEHQTPSVFPGNFRKRKVLGTLCFPFCLPEKYMQAKLNPPIRACAPPLLSHLLISFPPGRGSGRARGAVRRVRVCDCDKGPLERDHWVCIINNEGALKKK